MKRSSIIFLQVVIVLTGIAAAALLLLEPRVEGVNKNRTNFEIYFHDPFLAIVYAGSIPFFVALYQTIRALGYVGRNQAFSPEVVRALRIIRYCAIAIIGFVVIEEIWLMVSISPSERDNPGAPILLGLIIVLPSIVVAITAAMFERIAQNAVDLKLENDLTV